MDSNEMFRVWVGLGLYQKFATDTNGDRVFMFNQPMFNIGEAYKLATGQNFDQQQQEFFDNFKGGWIFLIEFDGSCFLRVYDNQEDLEATWSKIEAQSVYSN